MPRQCRGPLAQPATGLPPPPGDASASGGMVGQGGLEPPTPRLSSVCSNQLSYWPSSSKLAAETRSGPLQPSRSPQARTNPASSSRRTPDQDTRSAPERLSPSPASPRSGQIRSASSVKSASVGSFALLPTIPSRTERLQAGRHEQAIVYVGTRQSQDSEPSPHRQASLKGGDPAAGSPTATLLRLHPSR